MDWANGLLWMMMGMFLVWLIVVIFFVVILWKIFTKAGEAGWKSLIPIYNTIILLKIAGKPWWWILLLFVPFVNIVVYIIVTIDLSKRFGKGTGFWIGLFLLFPIFGAILAFGDAKYNGADVMSTEWWEDKLY